MPPSTPTSEFAEAAKQIGNILQSAGPRRSLTTYHAIGKILHRTDVGWGGKKHETIAKLLKRSGVEGMGVSTLHKSDKFAQNVTTQQAKTLDKRRVRWRVADRLLSKHVTPAKRAALLEDALAGRIVPKALGKTITQRSGVSATRGTRSVMTAIDRAVKEVEFLLSVARGRSEKDQKFAANTALRQLGKLIDERLP